MPAGTSIKYCRFLDKVKGIFPYANTDKQSGKFQSTFVMYLFILCTGAGVKAYKN